jgi:hypothetical protein
METLTYFIEEIFVKAESTLGDESHQTFEQMTIKSVTYSELKISGSLIQEVVFEDVVFENCTFFGSQLVNCLFLNCLFINCKFKFSRVTDCNFEHTTWENCIWGLSAILDSEITKDENIGSISFESKGTGIHSKNSTLAEFLHLSA